MGKIRSGNNVIINIVSSLTLQIFTFISGLIIPRIILVYFGSEVNGLITSLNQFLSFISLVEGGLGSIVLASLYKPIQKNDNKEIASVLYTANQFYFQVAIVFITYSVIITLLYPYIANTNFDAKYIGLMSGILCLNMIVQYYLSISNRLYLEASKRGYIVYNTQSILIVITTFGTALLVRFVPNIFALKFYRVLVYSLQPIIFNYFTSKYISRAKCEFENKDLKEKRWSGLGQNIAFFIHSNTDVAVLTIFSSLTSVSIYSVYSMIVVGLRTVVITIKNGFNPVLGEALAKNDKDQLTRQFNIFEFIMDNVSIVVFGCTARLIVPFVSLYTQGIQDADYKQPIFALILVLSELIFCMREPHLSLDYDAGKFKETQFGAYGEAIINLISSVILVNKFGIIGVAIGTLIAVIFRTIYHVYYNKKNVINRDIILFLKRVLVAVCSIFAFCFESQYSRLQMNDYLSWFISAIFILAIYALIVVAFNFFVDYRYTKKILIYFFQKHKKLN